jgi:hypothetical protein
MQVEFLGARELGAAAALAAAGIAWLLYRRDTLRVRGRVSWLPAVLRALAVLLTALIFTEPNLRLRTVTGERGRVLVFVDGSRSMGLTDEILDPARKCLFVHRMGWVPEGTIDARLADAADELARAKRTTAPAELAESFRRAGARLDEPRRLRLLEKPTAQEAARWEKELREEFSSYARRICSSPDEPLRAALEKFDATPRWKRVEGVLAQGWLRGLSERHDVQLFILGPEDPKPFWSSSDRPFENLTGEPSSDGTDLRDAILNRVAGGRRERTAVALFSDGRHNQGGSPISAARMLGERGIPILSVAVGAPAEPQDLALVRVRGPETVYSKDCVQGEVLLRDEMAAGRNFTLRIECRDQMLWEKTLATEGSHLRTIPFDFPIDKLVARLAGPGEHVKIHSLPLFLKVSIAPIEGEKEKANNAAELPLRSILSRRRILLLDGRPRWEFRYLRNLFERDAQWELTARLADPEGRWDGTFPATREEMLAYDLIVLGDVPPKLFSSQHMGWIREFVEKRGGGLILIDGRRGHLARLSEAEEFSAVFPVAWGGPALGPASRLHLTESGKSVGPLDLASGDGDRGDLWKSLPPPRWMSPIRALPGAETLVQARIGDSSAPLLVFRRLGAGSVLFAAMEETWRWRYESADRLHGRYWNQVARWIMEPEYSVSDGRVSLDCGQVVYAPGEPVRIRARVRGDSREIEALFFREGLRAGSVRLSADPAGGGLFRGQAAPLEAGRYEMCLRVDGRESAARAEFLVRARDSGELSVLSADEPLLQQMSSVSGGAFFREEEAASLAAALEPFSREKVVETTTALWQSYAWFLPILALLTAEWIARKILGMV